VSNSRDTEMRELVIALNPVEIH